MEHKDELAIDSRYYVSTFELRSTAEFPPDFELQSHHAGFDAGLFLPHGDPDWFGRSSYPPRILLLTDNALSIVSHPSAGEPPRRCSLDQISSLESGHMLLKGWLRFTGSGFDHRVPYNTRGLPSVLAFLNRFRHRWLHAAEPVVSAAARHGAALDIKFTNALAGELDPGESVLMQIFQQPQRVRSRRWLLPYRRWAAGDLLALTGRRLLWITDRERESRALYGSIASYAPLDAVKSIGMSSGRYGQVLRVDLSCGSAWKIPIPAENQIVEDFSAALATQKAWTEVRR